MRIIDLTHPVRANMPVFPGTQPPVIQQANTVEQHGFAEKLISLYSHTGTHMDAPAHMLPGAKTLDAFSAADFYGTAVRLDVRPETGIAPDDLIGLDRLATVEENLRGAQFLILHTGWAEKWGQPDYFRGFPALSPDAARRVVELGVRGVGIDAISIDRMSDHHFPVHHILFEAGLFVIENLKDLHLTPAVFEMASLPLAIGDADGAPSRAIALVNDK